MTRPLTPLKESALRALGRAPLEHTPEGWRSTMGLPGLWNSHTIRWFAARGYVLLYIDGGKSKAKIRSAGKAALATIDWRAA